MCLERPLVSIVIPIYNSEAFLADALNSCLEQSYRPIEIICVDNNSNDKSADILKDYSDKHPQIIKICREEETGAPAARNTGMGKAQGELIHFLDSDDVLLPQAIETLMNHMENDIDATCGSEDYYFNDMLSGYDGQRLRNNNIDFQLYDILTHHPNTGAVLLKKSSVKEVKWDTSLCSHQEIVFWAELCLKNNARFKYIPEKVCKIRLHNSPYRISNQDRRKKAFQKYIAILKIESLLSISPYKTPLMEISFNDYKLQHAFDSIYAKNFKVSELISSRVDKNLIPLSNKFSRWSKEGITYFTNHYMAFTFYYLGRKLFGKTNS